MTRTHATYLFTLVFLCSAVMLDGAERKLDWRKGHLLAVNVEGHGGSTRSVVWRSYCIDGGDHVYSAVSRRKARMNLEVNDPVRFATAGNQLYVVDRKGKTHVLKYLRRETSADRCAKTAVP